MRVFQGAIAALIFNNLPSSFMAYTVIDPVAIFKLLKSKIIWGEIADFYRKSIMVVLLFPYGNIILGGDYRLYAYSRGDWEKSEY